MDIIYEIRRRHSVQKQSISAIARDMGLSRPTVRKHLNTVTEPKYEREQPTSPKLGQFEAQLTQARAPDPNFAVGASVVWADSTNRGPSNA